MPKKIFTRIILTLLVGASGGAMYLLSNSWGDAFSAINIHLEFEKHIPFVPNAIIAYLLIFPFLTTPIFLAKEPDDFWRILGMYGVLVVSSWAVFMLCPTTMPRPEMNYDGFVGGIFFLVRWLDKPHNLFPSLHVSSVIYVALVNGRFCPKAGIPSWICAILIAVSTLLVKQHAFVDVLGGVAFAFGAYGLLRVLGEKQAVRTV